MSSQKSVNNKSQMSIQKNGSRTQVCRSKFGSSVSRRFRVGKDSSWLRLLPHLFMAMPSAKRRPTFRDGELEVSVDLDVEGYRDRKLERIVIMKTDTIEEVKGKIHWQGEIPVAASGELYKRLRHGNLKPLNDTLLVRNYKLRDGASLVYSNAD